MSTLTIIIEQIYIPKLIKWLYLHFKTIKDKTYHRKIKQIILLKNVKVAFFTTRHTSQ